MKAGEIKVDILGAEVLIGDKDAKGDFEGSRFEWGYEDEAILICCSVEGRYGNGVGTC